MATTVGQHSVAAFTSPINGTTPIDANTVRSNDNTVRLAYVDHDADTGIHVQSSTLASRPIAGTAGRKWITEDSGVYTLWFDDGVNWHPVSSEAVALTVLCTTALNKGDVVKIVGWNNGQDLPEVAKVASSSDIAFAVMTANATINTMGYAINTGTLQDIDTAAFAVGNILYPNTTGGFTTTKPTSGVYQPVAFVLRANATNGVVYVEFSAPRIVEASTNTASTVVLRDGSGNFSAGTITANLTGNITGTAPAGTLTGTTLASNVVSSSLTSVGTLSTLAVSGNLTVDTTTLTVDATNNRVGIGTATPGAALDVASGISRFGGTGGVHAAIGNAFLAGQAELYTLTTTPFGIGTAGTQPLRLYTDSTLRATLDTSGNLGLGVVPSAWSGFRAMEFSAVAIGELGYLRNAYWNGTSYIYRATAAASHYQLASTGEHAWFNAASGTAGNAITFTQRMTLDTAGNLGLAATPNASWGSNFRAMQYGTWGSVSRHGSNGWMSVANNVYWDSTDTARYTGNFNATWYLQRLDGQHQWYNAASGTAGNAISWVQAMTLDGSGNLGVGQTPVYRLDVTIGAGSGNILRVGQSAISNGYTITTNGTALTHAWANAGSNAMTLDTAGNLGLGVTPSTWGVGKAIEINSVGNAIWAPQTSDLRLLTTARYDGSVYRYTSSGNPAAAYFLNGSAAGGHIWYNAPSGTAGNAITFTQAMTLDASGNLGIGTPTPTRRLSVVGAAVPTYINIGSGDNTSLVGLLLGGTTNPSNGQVLYDNSNNSMQLFTSGTERARIDSAGNLLVGMTAIATSSAKTLHLANATVPTANPTGGGVLYVEAGALKYRGSSGTITTIANA